jgi:myo-inositol 2-dehydrogenase/D-chiro-inositol 1-dehydrogenase
MLNLCLFGAGRIGAIHAANITAHPYANLTRVVDVNPEAADKLARQHEAQTSSVEAALADPKIDAVVIASSTDTHADLLEQSARAGKAILCEKPIDLSLERVDRCVSVLEQYPVTCAIGFNRRHDPMFSRLRREIIDGRIGSLETLLIISRDPSPPPAGYISSSGGMFRDMTIHDLDMARWLLGEEPVEVFASASCLVDPAIGEQGDVDTAVITLRTAAGRLCQIQNSRRASYGYDQRIEAFGSEGMLQADNLTETALRHTGDSGSLTDKPLYFFLERYAQAYQLELADFIDAVQTGRPPLADQHDGRGALLLAEAALQSRQSGRPVLLNND